MPHLTLDQMVVNAEDKIIAQALLILKERLCVSKDVFLSPSAVTDYFKLKCMHLEHEVFGCLFLNVNNGLIKDEVLFNGTLTMSSVYPREVLKAAMRYNAASVIFYHNHPSGRCEPSNADIQLTKTLAELLALADVDVKDHFIVAAATHYSFAEKGLI
jgi:DNA repair protein RadC